MTINVIFVCLGNICRSPMAEAVFQHLVHEAGLADKFHIDSAGTGSWHIGEKAHRGTRAILQEHGIVYNGRARQVTGQDMADPQTYIITMDQSNSNDLRRQFETTQISIACWIFPAKKQKVTYPILITPTILNTCTSSSSMAVEDC